MRAAVTSAATVTAVDGRTLTFDVGASDDTGEIGRGTHTRAIVDVDRFLARTQGCYRVRK